MFPVIGFPLLPKYSDITLGIMYFPLYRGHREKLFKMSTVLTLTFLRYHGRWIDSFWKSRSYAGALKENPSTYTFSERLIVIEYNDMFEIF